MSKKNEPDTTIGSIANMLAVLSQIALAGQPNATQSGAWKAAEAAQQGAQGLMAQERQKKMEEEAKKKNKKGIMKVLEPVVDVASVALAGPTGGLSMAAPAAMKVGESVAAGDVSGAIGNAASGVSSYMGYSAAQPTSKMATPSQIAAPSAGPPAGAPTPVAAEPQPSMGIPQVEASKAMAQPVQQATSVQQAPAGAGSMGMPVAAPQQTGAPTQQVSPFETALLGYLDKIMGTQAPEPQQAQPKHPFLQNTVLPAISKLATNLAPTQDYSVPTAGVAGLLPEYAMQQDQQWMRSMEAQRAADIQQQQIAQEGQFQQEQLKLSREQAMMAARNADEARKLQALGLGVDMAGQQAQREYQRGMLGEATKTREAEYGVNGQGGYKYAALEQQANEAEARNTTALKTAGIGAGATVQAAKLQAEAAAAALTGQNARDINATYTNIRQKDDGTFIGDVQAYDPVTRMPMLNPDGTPAVRSVPLEGVPLSTMARPNEEKPLTPQGMQQAFMEAAARNGYSPQEQLDWWVSAATSAPTDQLRQFAEGKVAEFKKLVGAEGETKGKGAAAPGGPRTGRLPSGQIVNITR